MSLPLSDDDSVFEFLRDTTISIPLRLKFQEAEQLFQALHSACEKMGRTYYSELLSGLANQIGSTLQEQVSEAKSTME